MLHKSQSNKQSFFNIHGVRVAVRTDSIRFDGYCSRFLHAFVSADCPGTVDLDVTMGMKQPDRAKSKVTQDLSIWGKGVEYRDMWYLFRTSHSSEIYCMVKEGPTKGRVIYCYPKVQKHKKAWRALTGIRAFETQLWMGMIREAIILPALSVLLERENTLTLHGSAVSRSGKALVLTGLNGSGKSGLALELVANHGFQFLADNYAPINMANQMVLPLPEPLRVSSADAGKAGRLFVNSDKAYGKSQLHISDDTVAHSARISAVAHIAIGSRFSARLMDEQIGIERLSSMHQYLSETPQYSWSQLYYHLAFQKDLGEIAQAVLRSLCESVPSYEVTIPWCPDSSERYTEIVQWIERIVGRQ